MNRSLAETGGAALVVSQFTLYGDTRKGRRPSWGDAARPEHAEPLVERFAAALAGARDTRRNREFSGPICRSSWSTTAPSLCFWRYRAGSLAGSGSHRVVPQHLALRHRAEAISSAAAWRGCRRAGARRGLGAVLRARARRGQRRVHRDPQRRRHPAAPRVPRRARRRGRRRRRPPGRHHHDGAADPASSRRRVTLRLRRANTCTIPL